MKQILLPRTYCRNLTFSETFGCGVAGGGSTCFSLVRWDQTSPHLRHHLLFVSAARFDVASESVLTSVATAVKLDTLDHVMTTADVIPHLAVAFV